MSSTLTIAVHGSTGAQGGPVARRLSDAGHTVRGLARSGAYAVDLLDRASLARAYDGAEAAVVHLPLVFDERAVRQADAIAAALALARVNRVVFNASGPRPPAEVGHPRLDATTRLAAALTRSTAVATIVAPAAAYMDNLLAPWSLRRILDRGELAYPLPAEVPVPWVSMDDLAGLIAELVVDPAPPAELVLAGAPLTGVETAAALSEGLGRDVRWMTISPGEYRTLLAPHLGPDAAAGIAALYETASAGPPPRPQPAMTRTAKTPLAEWAAAHQAAIAA